MQCYHCGGNIPWRNKFCPSCGHTRSRLIYVHLWGVIGGLIGSLIGFTLYDLGGSLLGGVLGIVTCELAAWLAFRSKPPTGARAHPAK